MWSTFFRCQFRKAGRLQELRGFARMMCSEGWRSLILPEHGQERFDHWEEAILYAQAEEAAILEGRDEAEDWDIPVAFPRKRPFLAVPIAPPASSAASSSASVAASTPPPPPPPSSAATGAIPKRPPPTAAPSASSSSASSAASSTAPSVASSSSPQPVPPPSVTFTEWERDLLTTDPLGLR